MTYRNTRIAATATLCALLGATTAAAENVTLSTVAGDTSVTGTLLSYDGNHYVLQTSIGNLVLEASSTVCSGDGCPAVLSEQTDLRIAGSGTVTSHLIPELAQAYFGRISATTARDDVADDAGGMTYFEFDRLNTSDLMMTLVHSNSKAGLTGLIEGDLNAAFTTRPANALEVASGREAGLGTLRSEQLESVIAYDALLVVTHPGNPIQTMSEMDIAAVFSGEYDNWSAFQIDPAPINVYLRDSSSNAHDLLQHVMLTPHRKQLGPNVIIMDSDAEIAEAVQNDPNGIGLTSYVYKTGTNVLEIEGVCGIRVPASEFSIQTGEYPLSRPVYFYHSPGAGDGLMDEFADYVTSDEAQAVIENAGFVNRIIASAPLNMQGLRVTNSIMGDEALSNLEGMRSMLRRMANADRLSTTIQFTSGSLELDSAAYEDIEALADLIRSDKYAGSEFSFMGFSDSVGRADLNELIALQRAEIVLQALISRYPELRDRVSARSVSYGELSPLGCNETRPGREVNRRVEVWVQKPMTVANR